LHELTTLRCHNLSQDEQLIVTVPFTKVVKIKSISVVGSALATDSNASEMKAFINRDDVDFDVGLPPH
jgi:hypothetical protein